MNTEDYFNWVFSCLLVTKNDEESQAAKEGALIIISSRTLQESETVTEQMF